MEDRMRDLDQLQEQDPGEHGRGAGTLLMATLVTGTVIFAFVVIFNRAAEPRTVREQDPLDQLDRIAKRAATPTSDLAREAQPSDTARAAPRVDATKLTFERELTEHEDRPEVLAALEAAAREEQTLAAAQPHTQRPVREAEPIPAAPTPANARASVEVDDDEVEVINDAPETRVQRVMPAGMAASSASGKLAKVAQHDKLVAAALPKHSTQPRARAGEDGEFTLQVISYDAPAPAQAFANNLRSKGHEAFVATGEVDGRGRYYRVRIGPFKTKPQAETYRHTFEEQERMNTIVVKRVDKD